MTTLEASLINEIPTNVTFVSTQINIKLLAYAFFIKILFKQNLLELVVLLDLCDEGEWHS